MTDKPCRRELDDCIEGDQILIECRTYGKWDLFQKSGNHKGSRCIIKKNASARILKPFTNVKK